MKRRLQTLGMVGVLLAAGVLLGSFLLEWRGREAPDRSADPAAGPAAGVALEDRIGVEVLNGAGDPGAAARVAELLMRRGFDVKTWGNAAEFDHDTTRVFDRSGRPGAAAAVADSLGGVPVRRELRPELWLDATVVLGRDWRERIRLEP